MRKFLCLFLLTLGCCKTWAQEEKISQYIFRNFENGRIKFKVGADLHAKLNYNTLMEEMLFKNGDTIMAMSKENKIDTIYLNNLKFIPIGDIFYEVISVNNNNLYIRHISTLNAPPVETGRGTIKTTSQTAISSAKWDAGGYYNFVMPEYNLKRKEEFYLKKGNKFVHLKSPSTLDQFYPGKTVVIKNLIQNNKIDFSKTEDMVKLLGKL